MNAVQNRLATCIEALRSSKVTERKKAVQELKELLDQNEIIEFLNKVSVNNGESSVSWDMLFRLSHKALLLEVDKHPDTDKGKTQSTRGNSRLFYSSLVTIVAKKANRDTPFIDCSTITDAVIYILEKAAYCKVVGDTYLTILHENVLLVPKYWGVMKEENWRALYELGIRLFEKPLLHSKLSTTIAIMDLIVKYGCEHSALVIVIKQRIFNFLKRVVQKAVADTFDLQFYTIKLLITVCEKLRKECRMAICKFGEEIFDKLLDMSNIKVQGMNEKKLLLIKFLLIIVECHHPGGVPENSDQAYAYNWMDWKKRLKQLNHLMNIEIEKSGKLKSLPTDFLNLTVEVYNQVFRWDSNFEEVTINQTSNDSVPFADRYSTKRRRVMCGFSDIIDRLKIAPEPVAMWPWLCVISYLVSSYPSLVNENDYSLLLNNMYLFLSSSKEPVVTDYLCRCGIALIDCRQNGYSTEEETTWNSILNSVLR